MIRAKKVGHVALKMENLNTCERFYIGCWGLSM